MVCQQDYINFYLARKKVLIAGFHINAVNIKKAPRVSSGLKTKESGNCKEAGAILQLNPHAMQ